MPRGRDCSDCESFARRAEFNHPTCSVHRPCITRQLKLQHATCSQLGSTISRSLTCWFECDVYTALPLVYISFVYYLYIIDFSILGYFI